VHFTLRLATDNFGAKQNKLSTTTREKTFSKFVFGKESTKLILVAVHLNFNIAASNNNLLKMQLLIQIFFAVFENKINYKNYLYRVN